MLSKSLSRLGHSEVFSNNRKVSLRQYLVTGILLLVGLILRLYQLDYRALWWDEGLSLFFSRLSYFEQARFAVLLADTNPPVYRMLLGLWTASVGSSAWATRLLSVFAGVVLVAVTYRLAVDLTRMRVYERVVRNSPLPPAPSPNRGGGTYTEGQERPSPPAGRSWGGVNPYRVGFIAAALAVGSPMLIYFAQEAKGYSLVATAGTLAVLVWQRLLNRNDSRTKMWLWILWGMCLLLALGSHYIFAFVLLLINGWSFWIERRNRKFRFGLLATQAIVAALLLPFVFSTYAQTAAAVRGETGEFIGLNGPLEFIQRHLVEFALGPRGDSGLGLTLALLLAFAAGYGTYRARVQGTVMASLILGPLIFGLALNSYHEFFFPRFLLYTVPLLLVLAAVGINELRFPWGSVLILSLAFISSLGAHYAAPGDPAEDWRPVAAAVSPLMQPGDGAIYVFGWIPGYLHAYLPPVVEPAYTLGYFTPENLAPQLDKLLARYQRIWLFDYQVDTLDERNAAGRWLAQRTGLAYAQWFGNAHVSLFIQADDEACVPQMAEFVMGWELQFCTATTSANPGEAISIPLAWLNRPPLETPFTVYVHILASHGSWVTGQDSAPQNGLLPFPDWAGQSPLKDIHALVLPVDTAAGEYTIRVGLYDPASGDRLPLLDGADGVKVGQLRVN